MLYFKKSFRTSLGLGVIALGIVSCGGSGSIGAGPIPGSLGSISFNLIGTAQEPVTLATSNGLVTGISGAEFTSLSLVDRFSQLVYHVSKIDSGADDLWLMNQVSGLKTMLTQGSANETDPSVSKDGSILLYASDGPGNFDIFQGSPVGSGVPVNLTNNAGNDIHPRLSPNEQKIVFSSNRDGNYDIYTMNANGTGVTNITNDGAGIDNFNPKWNPTGQKIAYSSNRNGNNEIYVYNSNGPVTTNHTNNAASDVEPDWAPDGLRIAFASNRSGNFDIYSMAGTLVGGASQLTNNVNTDNQPSYSPDGTKIFFSSTRDDTAAPITSEIYWMLTNGTSQTRLSVDSSTTQEKPFIAPSVQTPLVGTISSRFGWTACAGFLVGQANTATNSVLAFDTVGEELVGRSEARVVASTQSGINATNLLFTIQTTVGLSKVSFYNTYQALSYLPEIVNVTMSGAPTHAIVSFSGLGATAGQVVSILPYTANRSGVKTTKQGNVLIVEGSFPAVYNAQGKNIAPGGATVVKYDATSGALIEHR
ncbi:MAG TPA: hypothetical protein VK171_02470 [Fimbriimonas sp.]|nr:hypothetical protein [Fimbriimonas sp.]